MTLGRYGALTPQEARLEAKRILGQVAVGTDPTEEKQASRSAETIADLCNEHLEANNGRRAAVRCGQICSLGNDRSRHSRRMKYLQVGNFRKVGGFTSKKAERVVTRCPRTKTHRFHHKRTFPPVLSIDSCETCADKVSRIVPLIEEKIFSGFCIQYPILCLPSH